MDYTELFQSFSDQRILIIGDVMIDAYLWGTVDRVSPEAPVPVVSVEKRENRLGGAANVALNTFLLLIRLFELRVYTINVATSVFAIIVLLNTL